MNEQNQEIIEKLADKLGTTAEHLWSVLIKQATISSTCDVIVIFAFTAFLAWGYRLVREKTKAGGDWNDDCGSVAFPWVMWAVCAFLLVLTVGCSMGTIISGFVNPEYWALHEVLSSIKK